MGWNANKGVLFGQELRSDSHGSNPSASWMLKLCSSASFVDFKLSLYVHLHKIHWICLLGEADFRQWLMEYSSLECIDWEFSKSNWCYHSILEFQSEHALFRQAWFHVWLPDENGDTHFRCNLSLVFIALLCHISRVFINPLISVDTNGLGLEWILICLMGAWLSETY